MKLAVYFLTLSVFLAACVEAQNYCDASLCPSGSHIACRNNGRFGPRCPAGRKSVINLSSMRSLILRMHNSRRNSIAGGRLSGYQQASRMGELVWDNELAKIALMNAKRCFMAHDTCRNTQRFKRAGQNLGQTSTRGMANKLRSHLIQVIGDWYSEHKVANMNIINSFQSPKTVGHFTTMVNDRNTRIGCGTVRFTKNGRNTLATACNYAATNIFNRPVYVTGSTGSGCTTGRSSTYPNLCSTSEPIDPNRL